MTRKNWRAAALPAALLVCCCAAGQDQFELYVPSTDIASTAHRTAANLQVTDAAGAVTVYRRDPRYDTADGGHLAYTSREAGQVIRWPRGDRGPMLIGTLDSSGGLVFRESRMQIRPAAGEAFVTDVDSEIYYRLTSAGGGTRDTCLAVDRGDRIVMQAAAEAASQQWRLVEAGGGYYRLLSPGRDGQGVLGIEAGTYRPRLMGAASDIGQLWRISPIGHRPGCFRLVSAIGENDGRCLAGNRNGTVTLVRRGWGEEQYWTLRRIRPVPRSLLAAHRVISRQITPDPALPPARVALYNSHSKEIWVVVADLANPGQPLGVKIPPGQSETISLARDPGATLVEIHQFATPYGDVRRDEFVTQLPPAVRYDVSVYELILQSVSIDRTVPGGRLDGTNYSPRSIGLFLVPPGAALQDGRLDVYQLARQQQNPGAVRRIDPDNWSDEPEAEHPVDALLRQFQPEEIPPLEPEEIPPPKR